MNWFYWVSAANSKFDLDDFHYYVDIFGSWPSRAWCKITGTKSAKLKMRVIICCTTIRTFGLLSCIFWYEILSLQRHLMYPDHSQTTRKYNRFIFTILCMNKKFRRCKKYKYRNIYYVILFQRLQRLGLKALYIFGWQGFITVSMNKYYPFSIRSYLNVQSVL